MQYLLLIYNDPNKMKALTQSDYESMSKGYQDWIQSTTQSGHLRSTGNWPAVITTVRVAEGKTLATDGPFAEAREGVGGFVVIEADSHEEAVAIAARIPSAATGAIEVRPLVPIPGGTAG